MNNLLSIIVLNRSLADDVIALYENLKKQTFQNFDLIVLDDNSEEKELEKLKNITDERFIVYSYSSPFRFGYDLKWNFILKKALSRKPKYIYTIHNDMKINNPNLLEQLVNYLEQNESYGAVAPTIYNGSGVMTWGPGIVKVRMGKEYIMNETYMVRSKCFIEMGLINEKLIYYGTEYYTFNWLRNNGYSTKIIGNVSVTHYAGMIVSVKYENHSRKFQNQKDYYRPRTSILIMKLFCKDDSLKQKIIYFYEEMGEQRLKMKKYLKNAQILKFTRTLLILTAGTLAGLIINVEENKALDFNQET
tara:strand:- start:919 stop:1830 length:912 start_codon:yes stop_codon:yes gene_type:complete